MTCVATVQNCIEIWQEIFWAWKPAAREKIFYQGLTDSFVQSYTSGILTSSMGICVSVVPSSYRLCLSW